MKRSHLLSFLIIGVFLIASYNIEIIASIFGTINDKILRASTYYSVALGIVLLVSALLYTPQKVAASLGLNKGFFTGMSYGLLFTLPMFIGYASIGTLQEDWTLVGILFLFIGAAMEEVLYRGFLFGQLFRKAGWGFIPAVLLNAVIFGMGHLYQGNSFGETMGVFLVTLLGGIWFAWLYIEWEDNLWIAISLHIFMNLSWLLFSVGDTALGGWGANFFRIMTIAFSIVFTIMYRQQQGFFRVNKTNLFLNKTTAKSSIGKKQLANSTTIATIILLLISTISLQAQSLQTIKGVVIDQQTDIPLIGATIEVSATSPSIGTVTDIDGAFSLKAPYGRQTLLVSYIGYELVVLPNVLITAGKEVILEIKMEESITDLEEITVSSKLSKGQKNNEMATISSRSFSLEEVTRFAGTMNDVSRMAANFAGVFIPDNERNDIIIRGNSPIGLLWRLEGIPISNPNHFSTLGTTGGVVSAINPNILKNSDFLTGAFPAEYGNTTSGVFDLAFRNGNKDRYEFTAQLAAFSGLEFTAEGPLNKKHNSSFVIAYRHSFLELLDVFGLDIGIGAIPNYKDVSFKLDFNKNRFGKFSIFGLGGSSDITFGDETQREVATSKLGTIGLNHNYLLNDKAYIKTTLAYSGAVSSFYEYRLENELQKMTFDNEDLTHRIAFNSYYHQKINAQWNIRGGITNEVYSLDMHSNNIRGGESKRVRQFEGTTNLLQAYLQSTYRFSSKLLLNGGLHLQSLSFNNSFAVEPRLALEYTITPSQTISIGYGLHEQMQALPIYLQEKQIGVDNFIRTNEALDFSQSNHFILGYALRAGNNWSIKADAYYQALRNIPVDREASYFSALNIGADFEFPERDDLVNGGTGANYGLEVTVEKYFDKSWYGLLTMSLSDSKYKGSDNISRNTAFNNGSIVNLLLGKEFNLNKRKDNKLTVDVKVTRAGGRYFTPIDVAASRLAGRTVRDVTNAFSSRYTPYFRLDTKIGYRLNSSKSKLSQHFFVEFQNITNHKNPLNNYFSVSRDQVRTRNQLGFFFDIMYRVQF